MTGARPTPTPLGVVLDLGNVLIDWQPALAVAAGVGAVEAQRFLEADDVDFLAWNHLQDAGRPWTEGLAEVRRTHPHWAAHAAACAIAAERLGLPRRDLSSRGLLPPAAT